MNRNTKLAVNALALVVAMVCLTYASVPLYRLFCQVTGFGGTTQEGLVAPGAVAGQTITVRFNADHDPSLPWEFKPGATQMRVTIGEQSLTHYEARNNASTPVTGHASYNVVPNEAGPYFVKIHCFCFENQTLKAGQRVDMPVSFYIDPAMLSDPETKHIRTITLSYTFFPKTN